MKPLVSGYLVEGLQFSSQVFESVHDWIKLVDHELWGGEEEGNNENEEVCHNFLCHHPVLLLRDILPDYVVWRWGIPGEKGHQLASKE